MAGIKQHIRQWIRENGTLSSNIGDIVIEGQIGEGGTALVYRADFMGDVAVKFLGESVYTPPSTRYGRFLGEYRHLVQLIPTGAIVPLYHFGIQDMGGLRVPYIVMQRCDMTLHDMYSEDRLRDLEEFRALLDRLLSVLETIHDAGIVHRDLKPRNILLRPNGDWVLADFGISWFDPAFYERIAETGKHDRLANWQFSPPEQFRRDGYEHAMPCLDLYALGQILYYCVTGTTIRGTNYPRISGLAPELTAYDSLIDRMVRQHPEERFQSVAKVRDFLDEIRIDPEMALYLRMANRQVNEISEFDRRLARALPRSDQFDYIQASGEMEINRVLVSLAEDATDYNLWWTSGREASQVERLVR